MKFESTWGIKPFWFLHWFPLHQRNHFCSHTMIPQKNYFIKKSSLMCVHSAKTIPCSLPCVYRENSNYCCLLSSFCFVSSFFFSCLRCGRKHLIKNPRSATVGSVPSHQTIMGVYHVLLLTGIYWDFSMYHLKVEFNNRVRGGVGGGCITIYISLPSLSQREQQQERWDATCLQLQCGPGYVSATDALPLCAVGTGMTFHVVVLPLYVCLERRCGVVSMSFNLWRGKALIWVALPASVTPLRCPWAELWIWHREVAEH